MAATLAASHPLRSARLRVLGTWQGVEHRFDAVFGSAANPLRQLGALAVMMLVVLVATGVYLYARFDTSLAGAWRSVDALSHAPSFGAVVRGLHRHAADAFVVLTGAHLLREALLGRYAGFRRFSWLTGSALVPLLFVSAIGGFWLAWDELGQLSAIATAEWLDRLPLLGSPLARNFLDAGGIGDRLFSLFVFVHVGVPLLLVFGLWFHVQRLARATWFPTRAVALAMATTLLLLAVAAPVESHAPANPAQVPARVAYDWLLLFVHPLANATSSDAVWALVAVVVALLVGLPFLRQPAAAPVAVVDPANCNGCRRCFDDCPYEAITMAPHPLRRSRELARVDPDLCASCGICVGACPSSTPFRSGATLATGIDMPALPIDALRRRVAEGLAALGDVPRKIVAFGCDHGVDTSRLRGADVAVFSLACTAQLPPAFVEHTLRHGAAGVLVSGCVEGGCEFRLGQRWADARLRGTREPHLRSSVPRERVALAWTGRAGTAEAARVLQRLRDRLAAADGPAARVVAGARDA